jgi:alpha,alpha-trehalase
MISLDLNSLLYKTELDIAYLIEQLGEDASTLGAFAEHDQGPHSSALSAASLPNDPGSWCRRAAQRFALLEQLLWDPAQGLFFDAFVGAGGVKRTGYVSASTFYPLWASAEACRAGGVASAVPLTRKERALLVTSALAALEAPGGLLASARASRERFSPNGDRGWDYPNGWAPQQMLAWQALEAHGFHQDAERLAFSWLYLLSSHAIGHGGDLLESYDVVQREAPSTAALADRAAPDRDGSRFAWTAASFKVGLALLDAPERARLAEAVASAGH